MSEFELVGRIPAGVGESAAAEREFGLLLCTRDPKGKRDGSGATLLRKIPPPALWDKMPEGHIVVNGLGVAAATPAADGSSATSESMDSAANLADLETRYYRLPYDLLISAEEARFIIQGAAPGCLSSDVRESDMPSICNAHISYPPKKRGKDGEEWEAFWHEKVHGLAGRWARVTVESQRYSFAAREKKGGKARRIGTRLVMKNIAAFE